MTTIKKTRKRYSRLIDERNKLKNEEQKITDEATVDNHIQRIKQALNDAVKQVEDEDIDNTTTSKGEGEVVS
jgi:hypothetical protein